MNSSSLYAFYGSLRRGMSNYERYKAGLEFLYEEQIRGYHLYQMEHYPYAVKTNQEEDAILVEVFKITDSPTEKAIHDLEISVGYYYDEVEIRRQPVGIYLFKKAGSESLVKDGDWVKFYGS